MAKKSKTDAVASGKAVKPKAAAKSTAAKTKKPARHKKPNVGKIEPARVPPTAFDPTMEQIEMRAYFISERRRRFALLRAVGATRGQVRRAVLAEQALLAVGGGLLGYLPGALLGRLGVSALASHGILLPGSAGSASPWLLLLGCVVNLPVCLLSGLVAAQVALRAGQLRDGQADDLATGTGSRPRTRSGPPHRPT